MAEVRSDVKEKALESVMGGFGGSGLGGDLPIGAPDLAPTTPQAAAPAAPTAPIQF